MTELISKDDLLEEAFGILANVSGGDLETQTPEWNSAFRRFRSRFHACLDIDSTPDDLLNKIQFLIDTYGRADVYKALNTINILTMEEPDGGTEALSEGSIGASE